MKTPVIGDLVEIWEPIENSTGGLEIHLVQCTTPPEKNGSIFRAIHHKDGGLCCIPLSRINRILHNKAQGDAMREFILKTKKEKRYGY